MVNYGQTNVTIVLAWSKLPNVQCLDLLRGQTNNIWQTFEFLDEVTKILEIHIDGYGAVI